MAEANRDNRADCVRGNGPANDILATAAGRTDAPLPPRQWKTIGALLGLAVAILVAIPLYAYTSHSVGDRDPFMYAQIGKEILAGKRLYAETWIDKPPLGLLMYAAPQAIAPRSYRGLVVFLALILAAQAVMFARALRGSLAAATAAVLFVLCYPLEDGTCT